MRVVLELKSGPDAGRKVSLVSNQLVQVGSSNWAEFVVEDDPTLVGKHFVVETDYQVCRVRDTSNGPGTMVNGKPVAAAVVRNGDRVKAGESEFELFVEGDAQGDEGHGPAIVPAQAPAPKIDLEQRDARFEEHQCDSGVIRYEGSTDDLSAVELARLLMASTPLHAIADFRRLDDDKPDGVDEPKYLFEWMGETASENSPWILHQDEIDLVAVLETAWKRDAMVCLFSSQSAEEMAQHLRQAVRTGNDQVVGICWPSILGPLLEHYRTAYVQPFMEPLEAVLVESAEQPTTWELYSAKSMIDRLESLGLNRYEAVAD